MSLRIDTIGADAFAFARLSDTLEPRPTPQTLRSHVGAREFGDFGAVLMAEKPVPSDLSAHVARWRAADRARLNELPIRANPDQNAEDARLRGLLAATSLSLLGWIAVGLIAARLGGAL